MLTALSSHLFLSGRWSSFGKIKGVLGRLVFEHFARCHVNNQSRPEKNVYPIDSSSEFFNISARFNEEGGILTSSKIVYPYDGFQDRHMKSLTPVKAMTYQRLNPLLTNQLTKKIKNRVKLTPQNCPLSWLKSYLFGLSYPRLYVRRLWRLSGPQKNSGRDIIAVWL